MLVGGTTAGNAVRPDDAVAWGYKTTSSAVDNHWMMAVDGWEDDLSCGSDIGEEPIELRKTSKIEEPTQEQRARHELENHAIFRPWCKACVAGRGMGSHHLRRKKDRAAAFRDGPFIYSDYFFMSTEEEGSIPMLAIKYSRSGRISATALPAKGATDFGVKFFRNFIQSTGIQHFVNFSDAENAMVSLKESAARQCPGVESNNRNCPVGDHRANGHIESAVKQIKGQMRSIRLSLEQKLGAKLREDHTLLQWIPRFAIMMSFPSIVEVKMVKRHTSVRSKRSGIVLPWNLERNAV